MMRMNDKISSHYRFIKKAEKDLVQMFKEGDSADFIKRYTSFLKITDPDIRIEEMYYESLDDVQDYQTIIDYALGMMNDGRGDYQLHMIELLGALNKLERYYDVISFADQLMEENISQGFRIDIANERHKAKLGLENAVLKHTEQYGSEEVEDVQFDEMSKEETLQFLAYISEQNDTRYAEKVVESLNRDHSPEVTTFMLLYLKDAGFTGGIDYRKFNTVESVVIEKLPVLEEMDLIKVVLPKVTAKLEKTAPEMVEEVKMLVMGHAIYSYPKESPVDAAYLADAYLAYLYSLINLDIDVEADEKAMEWIYSIEKEMNQHN